MSDKLLLTPQNIQNTYTLTQKFSFKDFSKGYFPGPAQRSV